MINFKLAFENVISFTQISNDAAKIHYLLPAVHSSVIRLFNEVLFWYLFFLLFTIFWFQLYIQYWWLMELEHAQCDARMSLLLHYSLKTFDWIYYRIKGNDDQEHRAVRACCLSLSALLSRRWALLWITCLDPLQKHYQHFTRGFS